jgi:probable phosphoglycerate mutase
MAPEIVLVRHGETEWSRSGRHTGVTDIPLTDAGRAQARRLADRVAGRSYAGVLTSPLGRARDTCRLAGLERDAEVRAELVEWDYGDYEGRTTADVRRERPGWTVWRDGCPAGETAADVGFRLEPLLAELRSSSGDVAVFAHGHVLRVLAALWIDLPPGGGARLALDTAAVSILGYERETSVLRLWNDSEAVAA